MKIVIRGIGVVGAFGCGVAAFGEALEGRLPIPSDYAVTVGSQPRKIQAFRADTSSLETYVPARALRRIDYYSRLGLLGSHLALADAGAAGTDRDGMAVVIASGHGATGIAFAHLNSFAGHGDICASPTQFANSLHNSAAANISILLGATGPILTVTQLDLSVPSALMTARQWLVEGRVDRLLFGAIDEMSDFMGYVWSRERGEREEGPMTPLRTGAETAVPSEGAAFFLLSRDAEIGNGYCTLDDAVTGGPRDGDLFSLRPGPIVVAADGRPEVGRQYAARAANARVACFSPVYGCTPAGPAFDVAASAIMLKEGRIFPSPHGDALDFPATVAGASEPLGSSMVDCLALTSDGGYGRITVGQL